MSVQQKLSSESDNNATRYSQTKEKDRTCELTVMLRNNEAAEQKVKLAWYFVGNPLMGGLDNYVYDKGEEELTLFPRSSTNVVQKSKPVESKIAMSRYKTTKSGAKHLGYIVMLTQTSNQLGTAAAPMSMEKVVRDPEAMSKLLAAPPPP